VGLNRVYRKYFEEAVLGTHLMLCVARVATAINPASGTTTAVFGWSRESLAFETLIL
jgi:hypothetical protein